MAYEVNYSDTQRSDLVQVQAQTLNKETSLKLLGKNFFGYGEYIAENFLHLMENFASSAEPANPVIGQLWFKKTTNIGNAQPTISTQGTFKLWDGIQWTGLRLDTVATLTVTDTGNVDHTVTAIFDDGVVVSVTSNDAQFTLSTSSTDADTVMVRGAGFTVISKGINLNPTQDANGDDVYKLHGLATSAQYADLAEMYTSDSDYEPGTVIKIGGEAEVTQTTEAFCPNVFGIVSTSPAYLMNSTVEGIAVAVALEGRVPCKVIGPCKKGDRLVTSETPGVARASTDYEVQEGLDWYRMVGRAIADKTTEGVGLVEVVVGAK